MNCLICTHEMKPFLKKDFKKGHYNFIFDKVVTYDKCSHCGFTLSRTHAAMPQSEWEQLNFDFHNFHERNETPTNQPPYLEQAAMLQLLAVNKIISFDSILDYAAGYGTLSKILSKYFNRQLPVYDPYVQGPNEVTYISSEDLKEYETVLTSALMEHLFDRPSFDKINSMVRQDGILMLHTVVCENIPQDENWFYFEPPVHCAFHTNKSMSLLMEQWQYEASVYCPAAKSWLLIKKKDRHIMETMAQINAELQTNYFIYEEGFVAYWKGF